MYEDPGLLYILLAKPDWAGLLFLPLKWGRLHSPSKEFWVRGLRRSYPVSLVMAILSSMLTTILFLTRNSRPKMRSVWKFGQITVLIVWDFHTESGDWMCNLQYCDETRLESIFLLFLTKAPKTVSNLWSWHRSKQRILTRSLEISTGGQPWSIRAEMGVGAQVAGVSTGHVHLRCSGKEKWGCTYLFTLSASKEPSLSDSASNTVVMMAEGLMIFCFSCTALALTAYVVVTCLHTLRVEHSPVHVCEKWPA